jgi:hypothetical protein
MTSVTSPLEAGYLVDAVNPTVDTIQSVASATLAGQSSTLPDGATATAVNAAGSTVAVCDGTGFTVDLNFDAAAMAAPASFRAGIEQAAAILASTISNKETVDITIDYSGVGGGAGARVDNAVQASYATVRADLIAHEAPGDTIFNALPAGATFQGQSTIDVPNAEAKALGLISPNNNTTDDGFATFATDINPNLLVGVALHELTHALGRVPDGPQPNIFDLFRFTSPGQNLLSAAQTAPPAYFSLDGGQTKLADFGQTSDPSDFLNTGVQGPNDPFNEFYNPATSQQLSPVDLVMLNALGFNTTGPSVQTLLGEITDVPVGTAAVASTAAPAVLPSTAASPASMATASPSHTSAAHLAAAETSHVPQPDTSMQDHLLAMHLQAILIT